MKTGPRAKPLTDVTRTVEQAALSELPAGFRALLEQAGSSAPTLLAPRIRGSETDLCSNARVHISRLELPPGGSYEGTTRSDRNAWCFVIEGVARYDMLGRTIDGTADDVHFVPPDTAFRIVNPGWTALVLIKVEFDSDGLASRKPVFDSHDLDQATASLAAVLRPIRVLHVYKTFTPDSVGGLENAIAQMASATGRLGLDTRVVSISRTGLPATSRLGRTEHFRYRETFSVASNTVSLSLLADFRRHVEWADVIHYHFPWPFADLLHLAWRVRKPSIVTYHSDIVRQRQLMKLYQPLMRAFLGRVNHIVATSPNYLQTSDVLRNYADKTSVIPIGLDPASYPRPDPERVAHWRRELGDNFFLFIGVIRYYKGLHILLDAVASTHLPTVIVGSGPIENELRAHAQRQGLSHVRFLGSVAEEDKVALLQLSMAVVFPSHLRSEAFGVTLLEGAMFGKPLISSEIGTGTSYINIHEETGIVVPPSDPDALRAAMQRLAEDPGLRQRMGAAGLRRFEALFTAERMGTQYRNAYRALLAQAAAQAGRAVPVT